MLHKLSFARLKRGLIHLKKSNLYLKRLIELKKEEKRAIKLFYVNKKDLPRVFNLDLHIGVIADLEQEMKKSKIELTRWSISLHNHLVPDRLPITDPVRYINARKWNLMDSERIHKFQDRYKKFLNSFDGFVCTYSPVFSELYNNQNKPILIVAATRYEAPYTERQNDWDRFNSYLISGVKESKIQIYANNLGDADYINYFTGLEPKVVPSLCEKDLGTNKKNGQYVIIARDKKIVDLIELSTRGIYRDISTLGKPYNWRDLKSCEEVLVFPQNISTMTLFELATAGVSVAVPSLRWITELLENGFYLLNELSFHQVLGLDTTNMSNNNPANYKSPTFLDWWLERSDFYNKTLMPNVRAVDSIEDLLKYRNERRHNLRKLTVKRNDELSTIRNKMITEFKALL
jgi:hypothetical protein